MEVQRAKMEKDYRDLKEIIEKYEDLNSSCEISDPDAAFHLSCHKQRLRELEDDLLVTSGLGADTRQRSSIERACEGAA